jgi:3-oxoacyl-[acyl-carrier-protein] synthase II
MREESMRRRVVVTGMGVVSPLGHSPRALYEAQLEGQSGVAPITAFDATGFPTTFAAEVREFHLERFVPGPDRWRDAGNNSQFAAAATARALDDAGLAHNTRVDRNRIGVYLGTGEGTQDFPALVRLIAGSRHPDNRRLDDEKFVRLALTHYHAGREYEQELHTSPGHLAAAFDLRGPNYNCLTACAAGTQALGQAALLIRHGDANVMVSGGSHSIIHPLGLTGFSLLHALSKNNGEPTRASRPFDLRRDGFVLGEGAGVLILEELEHALGRSATVYAEITGYGVTADAYRLTDSHPHGRGAAACMETALRDAGLNLKDIGYINAHGTSTPLNDKVETLAIKQVFGQSAYSIPVSSSKSMLGHLIAAAGAVELITCIQAIRNGVLPPTINYEVPDPDCDLDYIPNVAREKRVDHVLSNNFGFGGQNASLIVSRFAG